MQRSLFLHAGFINKRLFGAQLPPRKYQSNGLRVDSWRGSKGFRCFFESPDNGYVHLRYTSVEELEVDGVEVHYGFALLVGVYDGRFVDALLLECVIVVEFGAIIVEVGVGGELVEYTDFVGGDDWDRDLLVPLEVEFKIDPFRVGALHIITKKYV